MTAWAIVQQGAKRRVVELRSQSRPAVIRAARRVVQPDNRVVAYAGTGPIAPAAKVFDMGK